MKGFFRIPPHIFQQLTPTEILLFYAIEHFHFTDRGCYASRDTLMELSGIGCNRRFAKAMKRLKDGGFIMEAKGARYTLVERGGVGVLKSFLFSPDYTATEKVYNMLCHLYPNASKGDLAALMQVSVRTVRRCQEVPESRFMPSDSGTKPQLPCGQNHNPSNLKIPEINKTTYTNLFGQREKAPEETNPEVVISCVRDEERQETEKAEALIVAAVKENSLDLFTEMPEYNKLFQELRHVFKSAPDGHIQQAVYHAIKCKQRVKSTLFAYAYGILCQNLKTYGSRPESPTIRSVNEIRLEFQIKKVVVQRTRADKQVQEAVLLREETVIADNKAYIDSLEGEERERAEKEMERIGNPLNLPFISAPFARTAALATENLREKLQERLWAYAL